MEPDENKKDDFKEAVEPGRFARTFKSGPGLVGEEGRVILCDVDKLECVCGHYQINHIYGRNKCTRLECGCNGFSQDIPSHPEFERGRQSIRKEFTYQKPDDFFDSENPRVIAMCEGYNACIEYLEWVLNGKPEIK